MKSLKTVLTFLLAAALLSGLVPAALAADNENVLTALGHLSTDTVQVGDHTAVITLTVPDRYPKTPNTVDLSNNLTVTYNTGAYKHVVAVPSGAATVGGAAVTLNVSYNLTTDAEGAPKSRTAYTVRVIRAAPVAPTFSGTIVKETTAPGTIPFINTDFSTKFTKNDGEDITSISIRGSNPTFGSLKLGTAAYNFGTLVSLTSVGQLTFAAKDPGTVSYDVFAYAGADTTHPIGNAVLTISAFTVPMIKSAIADVATKGSVMTFTPSYFTSRCDMSGVPLLSVEITPTNAGIGTWYFGSAAFTATKTINANDLGSLTFNAAAPGTATFNWRLSNNAGFSATGAGAITVTSPTLTLTPSGAAMPVLKGSSTAISLGDFIYTPSSVYLSYIKLTSVPAAADGYLYLTVAVPKSDTYGYPALAANTALSSNAVIPVASVANLRFATKTTSANTMSTFKWTATADLKVASATWAEASTFTVNFITGGALFYSTDMNIPLKLNAADISSQFASLTSLPLSYMTFTIPDKNAGALYSGYDTAAKSGTAITAATKFYAGKNPNIAGVSFVPAKDYTGVVSITYAAYAENGATLTGTITVSVTNSPGGTLSLQTDKNTPLQLDASAFQAAFQAATGSSLSHVAFTLPSYDVGTLYYNADPTGVGGSVVSSGSVFYVITAPYLSLVSFMPAKDVTGVFPITFTGYAKDGSAYYGRAVVSVVDSPAGIVTVKVNENGYTTLYGGEFSNQFVSVTGSLLSYVTFTPPPSTSGYLYDAFDTVKKTGKAVSAATKYYDGRTPDISGLTFVPAKNFVGTVVVGYKAFNAAGASFAGKLKFIVTESSQLISYETLPGTPVTMEAANFVNAFSVLSGGKALSSVSFELPPTSCGRLYYGYVSPVSYDSAVSIDKKYYLIENPLLHGVSFVPADSFTGSFTFGYTGYATDGAAFSGKIRITVAGATPGAVSYTTNTATPVTFNAADFVGAFRSGGTLSYVTFAQPYTSYGSLYYGYSSSSAWGTAVDASTAYYMYSWPSVSDITFVPSDSYYGTLAIAYTAYSTTGAASPGTVLISVKGGEVDAILYTTQAGTPVQFVTADFNTALLSKSGQSLNHVVFGQPSADTGRLYLGYVSPNTYTAPVTIGAKYYRSYSPLLSDVSFVPQAGFTGTVTIPFTAYPSSGTGYSGRILVTVGNQPSPFPDMKSGYDWAIPAVTFLSSIGIIKGGSDGNFHPADYTSRGDFILMVTRAFGLESYTSDNFSDVPLGIYYYSAIATAKAFGIVDSSDGNFRPAENLTRQDAMLILSRTLSYKGIPIAEGTAEDLAPFPDAASIPEDAVPAIASLVRAGVITGANGYLNPNASITRSEIAVVLYKTLML